MGGKNTKTHAKMPMIFIETKRNKYFISKIPQSTEGRDWFYYVDKSVSTELLEQLTDEFIAIYDRSPARLKNKLSSTIKDSIISITGSKTVRISIASSYILCE